MATRSLFVFAILAALAFAQDLAPTTDLVPDASVDRCPEISVGPAYFAPWFPWPRNCILLYAFIVWRPYPPRICYVYRCTFALFGRKFFIYFKLCRRLLFRTFWNIDTSRLTPNNFDSYLSADTFASSSNLNDLLEGQTIPSNTGLTCAFTAAMSKEAQASSLASAY